MNITLTTLLLSCLMFMAYVILSVTILRGLPESLSETYYKLDVRKRGLRKLFTVTMFGCAATLLPIWLTCSEDNLQWLVFLACSATFFVAVTPNYREGIEKHVHYGAAFVCCVSSILWTVLSGAWFISAAIFATTTLYMILFNKKKSAIFLFEVATILSVYTALILTLF